MSDKFIPNAYQTPNAYCDEFMYLLTESEWKVLSYAARRIFGFQKRQDRISLSQFTDGTISRKDGASLDHGTGLSKPTVIKCLKSLIEYRLIIKLAPAENNPTKNDDGDLYALQLDYDMVDYAGLIERANSEAGKNLLRTAPGRNEAKSKRLSIPLTGQSDLPVEPVNPIDHYRSIPLTTTGQSHLPELVNPIDTQYTVGKTEETKMGITHPDFDRACSILQASHPISLLAAGPVLLESDEKPYRLHIRLDALPADFMQHMTDALREANPRRHYRITYETPSTVRAAQVEEPAEDKPDPYAPTDEHLQLWHAIVSELSFDAQPNTRRAYIDPARPISVNGNWTIAVPSVEWWKSILYPSLKRVYKKLTGESTDFVFVEMSK